jgi:hypothetical protein
MIRLYRTENGRVVSYHEAWAHNSKIIEHWGAIGERGETREHKRQRKLSENENLERLLAVPRSQGFQPIDMDDHAILLIEYAVNGFGTPDDLEKRHELEERMNETLGWTGLGHCDGGSIGSGTMEICCFVVDFEIARRVIADNLAGTRFADYSRIFDEGAG